MLIPKSTLETYYSLDLINSLGLETYDSGPLAGSLKVTLALWSKLDFSMENPVVLHSDH